MAKGPILFHCGLVQTGDAAAQHLHSTSLRTASDLAHTHLVAWLTTLTLVLLRADDDAYASIRRAAQQGGQPGAGGADAGADDTWVVVFGFEGADMECVMQVGPS